MTSFSKDQMPDHSTLAIANEFAARHDEYAHPNQMQLHKLVFIANGWNLAVNDQPLVRELAQAWDNGPVFRFLGPHPGLRLRPQQPAGKSTNAHADT